MSWVAFLGLLWIVRDLFALIFLTFLLIIITLPIIEYFQRTTRFPRVAVITSVYLAVIAGFVGAIWYAVPTVLQEATAAANDLPKYRETLIHLWTRFMASHQQLAPYQEGILGYAKDLLDDVQSKIGPLLVNSARLILKATTTTTFAILFAYLVLLDFKRLTGELQRLQHSRLKEIYEDTAEPVVQFFAVLATSFRAQAQIAILNTVLSALGFALLGLPKLSLLILIVFFFSFIPVLGVFISTTPAVLVALNAKGFEAGLAVIVLVTIIHALEAYLFNPVIYGNHLKLNPVLILLILYVAHHFFGLWGAILGVPVATYFIYYVFAVPKESPPSGKSLGNAPSPGAE
jgi:predicted PurR-regulated permease PerM